MPLNKIQYVFLLVCFGTASVLTGANVRWENQKQYFKATATDTKVEATFEFEVLSDTFEIKTIRTSCGCTTTELEKKIYQAGENGKITAVFDLGLRKGNQKKYVILQTNDPKHPEIHLEIEVDIPYGLLIEPRFLYWVKGQQSYEVQYIDLKIDVEEVIEIQSVSTDNPQLTVEMEEINPTHYRLSVQPVIGEGEIPFFRSIITIELTPDAPLRNKKYFAYAFMKT